MNPVVAAVGTHL
jgi:hypothetical protein